MNTITLAKIQVIRYVGYVVGLIFMIMSIRVYINNYLVVETSISQAQQEITRTQSENDFMRNFQIPYLQTDLAQRMLMHRQKIPQQGGLIVMINQQITTSSAETESIQSDQPIPQSGRVDFIINQRRTSIK